MREIIPSALQAGICINDFWTMDYDELQQYFNAYAKRLDYERKCQAASNYNQAVMISSMVGCSLGGKQPPTLSDYYPDLFPPAEPDIDVYKEQFLAYAENLNKRRNANDG